MFTGFKKIVKPDGQKPTEFENTVAQELFNLEMSASDIKADLRDLHITAAKEVDVGDPSIGKKAIILMVPFKILKNFHKKFATNNTPTQVRCVARAVALRAVPPTTLPPSPAAPSLHHPSAPGSPAAAHDALRSGWSASSRRSSAGSTW